MTIIATKGTLDTAYPPLVLASTAAAFDRDAVVFHTLWRLDIRHEEESRNRKSRPSVTRACRCRTRWPPCRSWTPWRRG